MGKFLVMRRGGPGADWVQVASASTLKEAWEERQKYLEGRSKTEAIDNMLNKVRYDIYLAYDSADLEALWPDLSEPKKVLVPTDPMMW